LRNLKKILAKNLLIKNKVVTFAQNLEE